MSASVAASDHKTKAAAHTTGPSPAVMATYARQDLVFERGEGQLARRHEWRPLPRLCLGRRGECARPRPPQAHRGPLRPGREALAHVQPLSGRGPGEARRATGGGDVRRAGVLLQFRRRSVRGGDQDGAALPLCQRPARALAHHHLRRRLPRPHARDHLRRRQREIPRGLWASGRRLRPCAVRRSCRRRAGDRAGDGRDHDRAGARRGRRQRRAARVHAGVARAVRPPRSPARPRRGAIRHGPRGGAVRPRVGRYYA